MLLNLAFTFLLFRPYAQASPLALRSVERFEGSVKPDSYIVKWKPNTAHKTASNIPSEITVNTEWDPAFFHGFAGEFTPDALNTIRADPNVAFVAEDGIVTTSLAETEVNTTWGLSRISHRSLAYAGQNRTPSDLLFDYQYDSAGGEGVDVYVIDTGVYTNHSEFGGRATWGKTFGGYADQDGSGHGTHCAGTIAGTRWGVAKKANIIAVKVLSDYGYGSLSDIISGLNWVSTQVKSTGRPSIVSMSLGGPASTPLDEAVTTLVTSGVPTVVAAGNNGRDASAYSPARVPVAITVGATNIDDSKAFFSNYGPIVDIWAPGVSVISAWKGGPENRNILSGTSMAAPHVAGLLAYLHSINAAPEQLVKFGLVGSLTGIPNGTVNLLAQNDLSQID